MSAKLVCATDVFSIDPNLWNCDGRFRPTGEEHAMRTLARRSLVVLRDISAGTVFDESNLGLRRPGSGLPPEWLGNAMGMRATRDLASGTPLGLGDLETGESSHG